jgi:hypothetical protein
MIAMPSRTDTMIFMAAFPSGSDVDDTTSRIDRGSMGLCSVLGSLPGDKKSPIVARAIGGRRWR